MTAGLIAISVENFFDTREFCRYHSKPLPCDDALINILLVVRHTCNNPDNKVFGNDNCQVYNCPFTRDEFRWDV